MDSPAGVRHVFRYWTFDITATTGEDYPAASGTLTIEAGETYTPKVDFPSPQDLLDEHEERVGIGAESLKGNAPLTIGRLADDRWRALLTTVRHRRGRLWYGGQCAVDTVSGGVVFDVAARLCQCWESRLRKAEVN